MLRSLPAAALVIVLSASPVLACGGMVSPRGNTEMLGFDALLRWDGSGTEELLVKVTYTGGEREFGWVMPLPTSPEVTEADASLIDVAKALTEPPKKQDMVPELIPSGEDDEEAAGGVPTTVDVVGRTTIGGLRFVTLGGQKAGDVATWMGDHGFEFHDRQEPVLQDYLDRGWVLVAARVAPGEVVTGSIVPVRFRFETTEPVYPLAMAGTGHEEEDLDVRLFVLSPYRVESTTYPERIVRPTSDGYFIGVGRRLELRYAAPLGTDASRLDAEPSIWLSRYDGDLPSRHLTEDLKFGRAPDQTPIDYQHLLDDFRTQRTWIYVQRVAYPAVTLLSILVVAGLFIRRGRRRTPLA